jgi:hypothetical protein
MTMNNGILMDVIPGAATTHGATAHALIRIDHVEHQRRATCGLGALDRNTVNVMFSLPHGYWVRWDDLNASLAGHLTPLVEGAVEFSDYGVRRLAVPPVVVELAVVTGLPWRRGLRAAGSFAPFCQRVLLLGQNRRLPKDKLWEADYWGIGVWQEGADGVEELVAPAPWRQRYATPAGWEFRERAYDAWLGHTGQRLLAGPPGLFDWRSITPESPRPLSDGLRVLERFIAERMSADV